MPEYSGDIDTTLLESVGSNADIDARHDFQSSLSVDVAKMVSETPLQRVDALLQTHPDYDAQIAKWVKYNDCYEANDIYKYLHKHVRESPDSFNSRVKRGYYKNYCQSVVDLFVAYLFHSPIVRSPGEDVRDDFETIYADADLAGSTYLSFLMECATDAQVYGHIGVLVDAPQIDQQIDTEADRKAAGIRPYLTRVTPDQILDWELDRYGKFLWVKIEQPYEEDRSWDRSGQSDSRVFVIWDRTHWEKWVVVGDDTARRIGSGDHSLGEVPLVIMHNIKSRNHRWFGVSAIRDISDINIAILNWSSYGDEEIANRCLNVLTMQRDPNGDAAATISHHNVLEYAEGATPPAYLTPGATPLQLIAGWMADGKDEIYRLAKLGGSTGLLGVREATSGIAYAFEFNETNQSLSKKAESLEQGEREIHKLICKWLGKTWTGRVEYPKEFGVQDFLMELQILMESRTALTSDTAIREIEKRVVDKMFARDGLDLRQKIHSEIDAAPKTSPGFMESFGTVNPVMVHPQPPTAVDPASLDETDDETDDDADNSGDNTAG